MILNKTYDASKEDGYTLFHKHFDDNTRSFNSIRHNILIIGNGFDLAHGLKTSYADFLNSEQARTAKANNPLLNFLYDIYESNNKNWIDFEKIIEQYIRFTEAKFERDSTSQKEILHREDVPQKQINNLHKHICSKINWKNEQEISYTPRKIRNHYWNCLYEYLNNLAETLDDYLTEMLSKERITEYPAEIYSEPFTHILSFNYTNTYFRVCKMLDIENPVCLDGVHYIHGHCSNDSEKQNIVLGVSDFDTNFHDVIQFKKFYQRITHRTGLTYRYWIGEDQYADPKGNIVSVPKISTATFVGHSMDNTDGDIIRDIIHNCQNTTIYHHNQASLESIAKNLVEVFSTEQFLELYKNGRIIFKLLAEPVSLKDK